MPCTPAGLKTLTFGPSTTAGSLSEGSIRLVWDALLANRPVAALAFSPLASDSAVLVAYGPVGSQLGSSADLLKVGAIWIKEGAGGQRWMRCA